MVGIAATETLRREPAAADAAVAIPLAAALHVDQATWRALASARRAQHAWSSGLLREVGDRGARERVRVREREVFVDNHEVTEGR